jgi:hypothetical protein
LDCDLHFVKDKLEYDFNGLAIGEVKQEKMIVSPFIDLMKKHQIREGSLSKYCMGVILFQNSIRYNNFKPYLRKINKVINGTAARDN